MSGLTDVEPPMEIVYGGGAVREDAVPGLVWVLPSANAKPAAIIRTKKTIKNFFIKNSFCKRCVQITALII
jgi:hypothetical protein